MSNKNDRILKKIISLTKLANDSGATRAEAAQALALASKLMTEYDISELDIKKVDKTSFIDMPFQMFRLGMFINLLQDLAKTFDCESYYYKRAKEFHFFGFEVDVKVCLHFAKMLSQILEAEILKYKKSKEYKELTEIYQPKALISNFERGFYHNIEEKLERIQEDKKEIIESSGTALMVIKSQQVSAEFERLNGDIKVNETKIPPMIGLAYLEGKKRAEYVEFNNPIETSADSDFKQICTR